MANKILDSMIHSFQIRDLGLIDWPAAYEIQKTCVANVLQGGPETLLLCEHPPVLTKGRMTRPENILFSETELQNRGIQVFPIDRGGDVTLHAPGQLVAYPILDLNHHGRDLKKYLHKLEEVAIDFLRGFGILTSRSEGRTGVWSDGKKIVSIGVGVRRWVTFHGVGINLNTDLELFRLIRPCGLDVQMTSVRSILGRSVDMVQAKEELVKIFKQNFFTG